MSRFDREKQIIRKAPLAMNTAIIINQQYENKELSEEEAISVMVKWVVNSNCKSFWFDIDELLRQNHENENWFWLVRRVRNNLQDL